MNKTLTLAVAFAVSGLILSPAVQAQEAQRDTADLTRADAETRAATRFARMDANSDGTLNAADREAHARARFAAQDADANGELSFEEMEAARESRRAERSEDGQRGNRGGHRRGHRGMRGGGDRHGQMLERVDTDGDGAISEAEFTASILTRFDRMDADSNGTVTAEERRSMRGGRRGHRGGEAGE